MTTAPDPSLEASDDLSEGLWTPEEAADFLRCSVSKIYEHVKDSDLPHFRPGGTRAPIRIPISGLKRWLRTQANAQATAPEPSTDGEAA